MQEFSGFPEPWVFKIFISKHKEHIKTKQQII